MTEEQYNEARLCFWEMIKAGSSFADAKKVRDEMLGVVELRLGTTPHTLRPVKHLWTKREADIARLVAVGMQDKEIARALRIQYGTVKTHLTFLRRKLSLALERPMVNRVQLALYVNGIDYTALQKETA